MSGRIVLQLDRGLGWTKPQVVAGCRRCGAELARHPNPDRALRAARRRRCPACGTRSPARLPGTTSLAADLAAYLAALGPDQLGRLTTLGPRAAARELTGTLNGQGLQVSERYVQQILDDWTAATRQPPNGQRRPR